MSEIDTRWDAFVSWLAHEAPQQLPVPIDIESVDADEVRMLVHNHAGTLQRVGVGLERVRGSSEDAYVSIRTIVCWEQQLDPREAMIRNSQLVLGHLELRPDHQKYWYRHMLWLFALEPPWEQFAIALGVVSSVADSLEVEITGEDNW